MKMFIILFLLATLSSCGNSPNKDQHEHDEHPHGEHEDNHEDNHEDTHEVKHDEGHHHEEAPNVGPGFAVIAADIHDGLKLSEISLKRIGLQTLPVESLDSIYIPHAAIVHERDATGVYRLREGWFKFIPIQEDVSLAHREEKEKIQSSELKLGDRVVVLRAGLLRIAELDIFTKDVEGHSH